MKLIFLILLYAHAVVSKNNTNFLISLSRGLLGLYCEISGLEFTEPNLGLSIPSDIDGKGIIDITINNSTIPSFGKVFCDTFPNINWLIANSVNIDQLEFDAFYPCQKLKFLYLNDNNIKTLPLALFSKSASLLRLKMMKNNLKSDGLAPIGMLTNLLELDLSGNELVEFPTEEFKKLTHLHELYLQSNYLKDIDERKIIEYYPNLVWIYIGDNDFMCSRLERILDEFKRHGKILETDVILPVRKRSEKISEVRGIVCIVDAGQGSPFNAAKNVMCNDFRDLIIEVKTIKDELVTFKEEVREILSNQYKIFSNDYKNIELINVDVITENYDVIINSGGNTFDEVNIDGSGN